MSITKLWFIFAVLAQYGAYARRGSDYMLDYEDYDDQYADEDEYDSDYYDDQSALDSDYDDSDYTSDLYNQYAYQQLLYNQMLYSQMYEQQRQNQMQRMYAQMLAGEAQSQSAAQNQYYNAYDYDADYSDYSDDFDFDFSAYDDSGEEYTQALALSDMQFLGKLKDMAKKGLKWAGELLKKAMKWVHDKSEKKFTRAIAKCDVTAPAGEDAMKEVSNSGKMGPDGKRMDNSEFQKFFTHLVWQLDIFLEKFLAWAELKGKKQIGIAQGSISETVFDGFKDSLLKESFQGVCDGVFLKVVKKLADMNNLAAPPNFSYKKGDRGPPAVSTDEFVEGLGQFSYEEPIKKAMVWAECRMLRTAKAAKDKIAPTEKKDNWSMGKRIIMNYLTTTLAEQLKRYAKLAFKDLLSEVQWPENVFAEWLKCVDDKGDTAVPSCLADTAKKHGPALAKQLKRGAYKAGKTVTKTAKADLKKLEKKARDELKKAPKKLTKVATKFVGEKINEGIQKKFGGKKGAEELKEQAKEDLKKLEGKDKKFGARLARNDWYEYEDEEDNDYYY